MQLCSVEHMLYTSLTFFSSKLDSPVIKTLERIRFSSNQNIGEGKSNFDEKNVKEVFNLCSTEQSCINIGITCYKIGTLRSFSISVFLKVIHAPKEGVNQVLLKWTFLHNDFYILAIRASHQPYKDPHIKG